MGGANAIGLAPPSSLGAPPALRVVTGHAHAGARAAGPPPKAWCALLLLLLLLHPHPGSGDLDLSYLGSVRVMPHNELALVSGVGILATKRTTVFGFLGGTSEGL